VFLYYHEGLRKKYPILVIVWQSTRYGLTPFPQMAAPECEDLRKAVEASYPAQCGHLASQDSMPQHDALYLFLRNDGSALVADELRLLADYLTEEPQHSG